MAGPTVSVSDPKPALNLQNVLFIVNVIGEQQAGLFLSRVPGQQSKTGSKERKQAQLSPVTPHHRVPQQNTHTEDPLSLYDGSLDGISDEEGRYIEYFHISLNSSSNLTLSHPIFSQNCCS